jgi:hypothetical protein
LGKTKRFKNPDELNKDGWKMAIFANQKKKQDSSLSKIPIPPPPPPSSGTVNFNIKDEQPFLLKNTPDPAKEQQNKPEENLFQESPVSNMQEPPRPIFDLQVKPELLINKPKTDERPAPEPNATPMSLPPLSMTSNASEKNIPYFSDVSIEDYNPYTEDLPVMDTETVDSFSKYRDIKKPLYVRTDFYSQVMSYLDRIKEHVNESSEILYSLENLKRNADIEHNSYKKVLEDIQRKIIYVDRILFEKRGII